MPTRQGSWIPWLVGLLWFAGCGANRHELYQRLPERDKELYDRSHQFMTDGHKDRYFRCQDSPCREQLVEELHIHDRLAKFQPYIREAILAQRVVPGMSAEAVILAWGRPREIDRRDVEGVPSECWFFQRGTREGTTAIMKVYFLSGVVTEVAP